MTCATGTGKARRRRFRESGAAERVPVTGARCPGEARRWRFREQGAAERPPMTRAVRLAAVLLVGAWLAGPAAAQSSAEPGPALWLAEAEQNFAAGNELAGAGRAAAAEEQFRAALLRYERAAAALGRDNGLLLYNIGNTYLRLGDLGRAVLHYREAQRLIPADPNLQQSLRHARSLRRDRINSDGAGSVLRLVFFWHYRWPLQVRVTLLLVAVNLLWLLAAWRALRRLLGREDAAAAGGAVALAPDVRLKEARRRIEARAAGAVFAVAGLVAVAAGGSVAAELLRPGPEAAVIVAAEVTARRGDGEAYAPAFAGPLHAGTELLVLEERPDWLHAALADGRRAWLPAHAVAVVGRPPP